MKKGSKMTSEQCKKISLTHQGIRPWRRGIKFSKEHKAKLSEARMGCIPWNKGKKEVYSKETLKIMSDKKKGIPKPDQKGEKSHFWKGGIAIKNKVIRSSIEFRLWRESIFARDNWTCQKSGIKGGKLHPHHIKNFAQYPELRFAIDNGITLSEKAHKEFHKKYGQLNNSSEQLQEFINNK